MYPKSDEPALNELSRNILKVIEYYDGQNLLRFNETTKKIPVKCNWDSSRGLQVLYIHTVGNIILYEFSYYEYGNLKT